MIIYRKNQPPLLSDYGIEVPMHQGRAVRVKEELEEEFSDKIFVKEESPPLSTEDFQAVHTKAFLDRCENEPERVIEETFELIRPDGNFHRYDPAKAKRPLKELVDIFREGTADTFLCSKKALESGFSYYLGGGFHHAMTGMGRGFCLFNDIIIAARKIQREIKKGSIWIIDIDAHKGCGSAEITSNDDSILTLSIHMKEGWPLDSREFDEKGARYPWFIPSTVDIGVPRGGEAGYHSLLSEGLKELERKSSELPVLCIVVDGSDPFEKDALQSASELRLTQEQCLQRNLLVYDFLKDRNIPQAYVMSGGYGHENWVIHHQFIRKVLLRRN